MSETPEILKAEIAALKEKLAEAEGAAPVEPEVEVVAAPVIDTAVVEAIAEVLAVAEEITSAVVVVTSSAPAVTHHVHAAQTAPARWALQPLAR